MKSSRAFTLIELLIVIAIIGLLAALLFPALNAAIDSARKAQAKNDVTQIATAVIAYETEYGRLPPTGTNVSGALLESLVGATTTNNPRRIVFIEVNAAKKGKGGTNASGQFVDPWGNIYKIALDDDFDNTITNAGDSPGQIVITNLRKKVAVWNLSTNGTTGQQKRRGVNSWD